jgi:hypothetical protein
LIVIAPVFVNDGVVPLCEIATSPPLTVIDPLLTWSADAFATVSG